MKKAKILLLVVLCALSAGCSQSDSGKIPYDVLYFRGGETLKKNASLSSDDYKCSVSECKKVCRLKDSELCFDCGTCAKSCPAGAVKQDAGGSYYVDPALCIKCGACVFDEPVSAEKATITPRRSCPGTCPRAKNCPGASSGCR